MCIRDRDEVVERLHGLFDRGARVEPVELVEVDVVRAEDVYKRQTGARSWSTLR